jgi:peptidoglycan/xylan/chitin deacetylase (PgdA/CDA1 family)
LITALFFAAALAAANCNCVAFRLDDVQDYYNRDGQIAAIKTFHDYNATLTIGVIGGALGQDKGLVQFLQDNQNVVEFANHGWLHEDFSALTMEEQARLLNQSNTKIVELFGVKPVTFIAPFNLLNNATSEAVRRNGMTVISADEKLDHPAVDNAQKIYHLPVNANISDYDEEQLYWKAFENKMIVSDVKKGLARDGYAMIMMHPRDFVDKDHKIDPIKLDQLKKLIDTFRSQGLRIVTVGELANNTAYSAAATTAPVNSSTNTIQTTLGSPLAIIIGAVSVSASLMFTARSRIMRRPGREGNKQ